MFIVNVIKRPGRRALDSWQDDKDAWQAGPGFLAGEVHTINFN